MKGRFAREACLNRKCVRGRIRDDAGQSHNTRQTIPPLSADCPNARKSWRLPAEPYDCLQRQTTGIRSGESEWPDGLIESRMPEEQFPRFPPKYHGIWLPCRRQAEMPFRLRHFWTRECPAWSGCCIHIRGNKPYHLQEKPPFRTLGNPDSDVDGQERDRISVSRATLKMNHLENVSGNEPVKGAPVAGKAQGTQFPKNCGCDCV